MSVDGNAPKQMAGKPPVEVAKAALTSLLATKKVDRSPSQAELAKQLKKEIAGLRAQGVSFAVMSEHLKASGITISKSALGAAVKVKKRQPKSNTNSTANSSVSD